MDPNLSCQDPFRSCLIPNAYDLGRSVLEISQWQCSVQYTYLGIFGSLVMIGWLLSAKISQDKQVRVCPKFHLSKFRKPTFWAFGVGQSANYWVEDDIVKLLINWETFETTFPLFNKSSSHQFSHIRRITQTPKQKHQRCANSHSLLNLWSHRMSPFLASIRRRQLKPQQLSPKPPCTTFIIPQSFSLVFSTPSLCLSPPVR